jgi:ABC-2 type transport system permease protein
MIKTLRIAMHEYQRHVFTRRFLLGLFSVPFLMVFMVGLFYLIVAMENTTRAVGYVDLSGLLSNPQPAPEVSAPDKPVEILAYENENEAAAALQADEIQAYFILPADYRTSGKLKVVHISALKSTARAQFYEFLGVNLLAGEDALVSNRILSGNEVIIQSADGSREISSRNGWLNLLIPILAALGFMVAMFTAGGYLMQAVVEEKENRTMEVLLTSVSPNQFMAGKILADMSVGLTQILTWLIFLIITIKIAAQKFEIMQNLQFSPQVLLIGLVVLLPTFVMFSALMALVGATVSEAREGQQMIGLISLPIWIPYMLTAMIVENPNSPLTVGLSLFPLTSSLTLLLRQVVTIIPAWQIAVSAILVVLSAAGAIWFSGRAFRLGMLRYGKRLAWSEIYRRRGASS